MYAGRPGPAIEYDVGFDSEGRLKAVHLRVWFLAGFIFGDTIIDVFCTKKFVEQVRLSAVWQTRRTGWHLARRHIAPRNLGMCQCDLGTLGGTAAVWPGSAVLAPSVLSG